MTRPALIFLLAIACSSTTFGQEAKTLPAVKRILDKATAEVKKNFQEFDTANQKPLGDARVELQDLSTKLIQDGKNVDARAVIKQIETLEADVLKRANAPAPVPAARPVPEKPLLDRMAGKWFNPTRKETRVFGADGSFTQLKSDGTVDGRPEAFVIQGGKGLMNGSTGYRFENWLVDDDRMAFLWYAPDGSAIGDGEVWFRKR
jgi:hypothetical protein